jgi:hypothetical protein
LHLTASHFVIDSNCGDVFLSNPDPPLTLTRAASGNPNPLTVLITNSGPGAEGSQLSGGNPGQGDPANSILSYTIDSTAYRVTPVHTASVPPVNDSCFPREVSSGVVDAQNSRYLPPGATCRFDVLVQSSNPPTGTLTIWIGGVVGSRTNLGHAIYTTQVSVP